jgi:hypothetical protein
MTGREAAEQNERDESRPRRRAKFYDEGQAIRAEVVAEPDLRNENDSSRQYE